MILSPGKYVNVALKRKPQLRVIANRLIVLTNATQERAVACSFGRTRFVIIVLNPDEVNENPMAKGVSANANLLSVVRPIAT